MARSSVLLLVLASLCQAGLALETLRIAVISEFTGNLNGNSKKFINGFRNFAAPYINSHGGIPANGGDSWQIEVVDYDTQSDAAALQANITAAIAAGQDMDGNNVGDIHAIIAATSSTNGTSRPSARTWAS
eukprot:SRR837773.23521.p2 GENE.SRR837773.23521~~SRR837773.23521.p2  ORF type:complete len:140 (-),score=46.38 SRR837773.23521:88-480(-)